MNQKKLSSFDLPNLSRVDNLKRRLAILNFNIMGKTSPTKKEHKDLVVRAAALRNQIRLIELTTK